MGCVCSKTRTAPGISEHSEIPLTSLDGELDGAETSKTASKETGLPKHSKMLYNTILF